MEDGDAHKQVAMDAYEDHYTRNSLMCLEGAGKLSDVAKESDGSDSSNLQIL